MGNACKFSKREPLQNAVVSIQNHNIISNSANKEEVEKEHENIEKSSNSNVPKNNAFQTTEPKMASEKTNESFLPPKEKEAQNIVDFEEALPKQFVEVQIVHLNKKEENNDDIDNDGNEIKEVLLNKKSNYSLQKRLISKKEVIVNKSSWNTLKLMAIRQ